MAKGKQKPIDEALSKNLKKALDRLKDNLKKEKGLSEEEAFYVASLYGELKDKDLFGASYIRDIELEADPGEKIPNLNNLDQMVKYPELVYDIVFSVLLETPEFLNNYDIVYNIEEKDIHIEKKKKAEDGKAVIFKTPWDKIKVAEDDNYVTFGPEVFVPDLKFYYLKVFSDDPRIQRSKVSSMLMTSWCVLNNRGYFSSQKTNPTDRWFFTFSKHNPIDSIEQYLKESNFSDKEVKTAMSFFNEENPKIELDSLKPTSKASTHSYNLRAELRNKILGEAFLDSDYDDGGYNSNLGIHNYNNNPGGGISSSLLNTPKLYDYTSLISTTGDFAIEGGTLIRYNANASVIELPEGIVKIGDNAFVDKKVSVLVLPKSLTTIMSGAFKNCSQLTQIRATNNLAYIQRNAFDSVSANDLVLGVFSEEKGALIVSKPTSLTHYPKGVFNKGMGDRPETKTESRKIISEKVRIKNKPLYDYESEFITIEHGVMEFKPEVEDKTFDSIVIPEGVKYLKGTIKGSYKSLVFPKSFLGWEHNTERLLSPSTVISNLDFSKSTGIRIVEDKKFQAAKVKDLSLPSSIIGIGNSFFGSAVRSIYIPSSVQEIDSRCFTGALRLDTIYTDNIEKLKETFENQNISFRRDINFQESTQ
jgi:hypothetical protein